MTALPTQNPGLLNQLMTFLQSPEARGIGLGLLQASQPNMTHPVTFAGALAQGLQTGAAFKDLERKRKLEEEELGVKKGQLGVNQEELGIKRGQLDINRGHLGLEGRKLSLEEKKYLQALQQAEQERNQLMSIFGLGGSSGSQSSGPSFTPSPGETYGLGGANGPAATTPTITVVNPAVNNGKPTQIPAELNGRPLSEAEAIELFQARQIENQKIEQARNAGILGGELSGPQQAANAGILNLGGPGAQPGQAQQPGILGQQQNINPNPPMRPTDGEDYVTLPNGHQMPREQFKRAQSALLRGDTKSAKEILNEKPESTPEIIKVAKAAGLKPGTPEYNQFLIDSKLKPSTQINIGENAEKVKQEQVAKMDVETIKASHEREKSGRELVKRAQETREIAAEMRKRGIDPARFWATKQLEREKIKASLGSQASQENVSLVERLNKNAVYLMSDMVKGLGGRPNQYVEQQFSKAVPGQDVTLDTIETLADALIPVGFENQYESRFLREYDEKHGNLKGASEAYEAWLDTQPFTKTNDKGRPVPRSEKEIKESWKLWVDPQYTYQRLSDKPVDQATEAELEFMARYQP